MGGIHALIGLGEGLITLGALSFIYAARRDLLKIGEPQPGSTRLVWAGGLVITALLAVLSPVASKNPDGLAFVAGQAGFLQRASAPSYKIISGYVFPGIGNATFATIAAAIVGAVIVLGVALLMAYSRRRARSEQ